MLQSAIKLKYKLTEMYEIVARLQPCGNSHILKLTAKNRLV